MGDGTKGSELTALQRAGLERLEACMREGITIRAYAKRAGLSEQQLYQMAKVLRRKGVLAAATRRVRKPEPPRPADALLVTAARDVLAVGREQLAPVAPGFENSGSRLISMPLLGEAFAEDAGLILPSLTADYRGRTAVPHPSTWDLRADREAIEGIG